ncbi:hypothetical protein MRY82_03460 [bacterium]|nr:hypothetical protein [bacterium]
MYRNNAFVQFLNRYFSWLSIPYLPIILAALPVLGLILESMGYPQHYYMFDPSLIKMGEYWRLLALPSSMQSLLWLIFYVLYVYYIVDALESAWGENTLSLFVVMSYLAGVFAGFIFNQYIPIWYYVTLNVSLAFGTLFPDIEFYLYFILRVKAKWLAILAGVFLLWQMITGSTTTKLILLIVILPYILFLGSDLIKHQWQAFLQRQRQKKFFDDQA